MKSPKHLIAALGTGFLLLVCSSQSLAADRMICSENSGSKKSVCKVQTNDIGTIIGMGSSKNDAFEDAASQCFDRRAQLYRMKKGAEVDEETGLLLIDNCANIRCGS